MLTRLQAFQRPMRGDFPNSQSELDWELDWIWLEL